MRSLKETAVAVARRLSAHHATQLAASISYYALLALFPAVIALTALIALLLDDPGAKQDVVDFLFDELPVSETEGRGDLESLVDGVATNAGTIGLAGLAGLIFSASALMTALRNSLAIVFEVSEPRSFLRGKALDIVLILGLGLLVSLSVAGTLLINLAEDTTKDDLGVFGDAIGGALGFITGLLPIAASAVVFAVLFTVIPRRQVHLAEAWPAVAVATLGFEVAKRGFGLYLDNLGNYSAVYGSLGAVVAFMVLVYLSAIVLLASAEFAAIRTKDLDERPVSDS